MHNRLLVALLGAAMLVSPARLYADDRKEVGKVTDKMNEPALKQLDPRLWALARDVSWFAKLDQSPQFLDQPTCDAFKQRHTRRVAILMPAVFKERENVRWVASAVCPSDRRVFFRLESASATMIGYFPGGTSDKIDWDEQVALLVIPGGEKNSQLTGLWKKTNPEKTPGVARRTDTWQGSTFETDVANSATYLDWGAAVLSEFSLKFVQAETMFRKDGGLMITGAVQLGAERHKIKVIFWKNSFALMVDAHAVTSKGGLTAPFREELFRADAKLFLDNWPPQ